MNDILVFNGVGKTYPDFALRDVSFSVPPGAIVGLVGPNGAGKTTLIRMATNLVRKEAGSITLFGLDSVRDEVAIKARVGFVPDEPHFAQDISLRTIAAALAPFYPRWDHSCFRELLQAFELSPRAKFGKLSQGMKTKFALALAFSQGAELLLLDEPTAGLDPVFRRQLLGRLAETLQAEGRSVLFSTHITTDLEKIADYVAFLHDGKLVFFLSQDEIRTRWRLVKGDHGLLQSDERRLFAGVRRHDCGIEALTGDGERAAQALAGRALVESASLEDILVLYGRGGGPLTGGDGTPLPENLEAPPATVSVAGERRPA